MVANPNFSPHKIVHAISTPTGKSRMEDAGTTDRQSGAVFVIGWEAYGEAI